MMATYISGVLCGIIFLGLISILLSVFVTNRKQSTQLALGGLILLVLIGILFFIMGAIVVQPK